MQNLLKPSNTLCKKFLIDFPLNDFNGLLFCGQTLCIVIDNFRQVGYFVIRLVKNIHIRALPLKLMIKSHFAVFEICAAHRQRKLSHLPFPATHLVIASVVI